MTPQEREQLERQRRMGLELSNSYREVMQSYAYRDLSEFLDKLVLDSNKEVDAYDIDRLHVAIVARARGIRETVEKIRKHIDYAINGGPR